MVDREDLGLGLLGTEPECCGERGSAVCLLREKEVVLVQVHIGVGLNPNSTIYCYILCGRHLNSLGLSFFCI